MRGQRRRLRHRPGPELAAGRAIGWEPDAQAEASSPPVQGVPLRHTHKGPASAGSSPRPSTCPARPTRASWSPRCPTPSRPGPSTSASTARGATWRTRSRSSSSISSPTGPRRRASPPTSSGSSSPPSPRSSSLRSGVRCTAPAWRNAAAQAPQDRRPRHGLGAKGQGRHGLRTPVGRRLRTRPRPIARVTTPHPLRDTRSSRSSGDHCAAGPKKLAQAAVPATLASPKHGRRAACSCSTCSLGRNSAPTLPERPSAVTV